MPAILGEIYFEYSKPKYRIHWDFNEDGEVIGVWLRDCRSQKLVAHIIPCYK